ncbi:DUF2491 family protein [Rhodovastum atsumiense]|uniref:DUF2491 family protein n=1 Tax=Rhodovastum atsumiense TaxID=504468 RepID=A0A5M6IIR2_9PROT|nr:DUF2491 family protein [Rhodovastum atsumiense]
MFLWLSRRAAGGTTGTGATAGRPPPPGSAEAGFRVGMTFPIDPSPFLLAGSATKVQAPPGGMTNVEAVGTLRGAGVVLHRLYLPGRQGFFQVHTDAAGAIDECRYFSLLDEVTPADAREWGVWLDPAEGMIGWPAFQTRDGKTYGRAWVPGGGRVSPQMLDETVQALDGTAQRRLQAMLYAAPTGAAPPAPPTEFVMVAAIQAADQAWVEIHAGIDVNPAALALPAAPDRRSA